MAASLTLKIGEFKEGEKNEEFPKDKEGERCKVDIGDFTKDNTSLTDKVIESIVLTLIKKRRKHIFTFYKIKEKF